SEVAAEFYTSPQKFLLGADNDLFEGETDQKDTDDPVEDATTNAPAKLTQMSRAARWEAYLGNVLAISRDENGDVPTFGQLPQMTMQPHIEYMRSLAAQFSGETGIPVSSLGIIHENPASAEAIHAAREDLIIEAEALNSTNGNALRNIGLMTLAIMRDKSIAELTDAELTLMPRFKAVNRPSVVSQSDAIIKQVSALPWLADTTVVLEELGYSAEQITRLLSDKRKASAYETVRQLSQSTASPSAPSQTPANTTPTDVEGEQDASH
ncbi:MAG: hypothetical protein LBK67_11445, partial [Coriobacteriales bacterium]|nr:hypothetical protein [Coriobacteriales bacterium]